MQFWMKLSSLGCQGFLDYLHMPALRIPSLQSIEYPEYEYEYRFQIRLTYDLCSRGIEDGWELVSANSMYEEINNVLLICRCLMSEAFEP